MAFQYGAIGILPSLGLPNTVARSQQYEMATRRIGRNARRLANFTTEYERLRHIGKIDPERANNANEYANQPQISFFIKKSKNSLSALVLRRPVPPKRDTTIPTVGGNPCAIKMFVE